MISLDRARPSGQAERIPARPTALIHPGEPAAKADKEHEAAGLVRAGCANGTLVNRGTALEVPAPAEVKRLAAAERSAGMVPSGVQGPVAVDWFG